MGDRGHAHPRAGDDRGLGLVGLLVTLALLGLLAAATAIGVSSIPDQSTVRLAGPSTGGAAGPAADAAPVPLTPIGISATTACRADAESVDLAQQAYRALSAVGAFAGTSPTTGGVSLLVQAHDLRSPPGNATRYTIDTGTDGWVHVTNLKTAASATFEVDPAICDGA